MTIIEFCRLLEHEFDEIDSGTLEPDSDVTAVFEWNSMNALLIMALLKTEFNVDVTGSELTSCKNIRDIYNLSVKSA